jgi:hypothetical protein
MKRAAHILIAIATSAHVAIAQAPAPPPPPPQQPAGKVDAKALMQSGLKLFDAKDYLGALAVFKDAYARFPSAKILLNIGTTQLLLDRKADAANSYQKYLDSRDADPAKRADVTTQLGELDKSTGVLFIAVTPDNAEVQIGDDWLPADAVRTWRVTPGPYTVRARKQGYTQSEKQDTIAAGAKGSVSIDLVAIPQREKQVFVTVPGEVDEGPRSRFGAIVLAHVSVSPRLGSALFVGGTADLTEQLSVDATIILGPGLVNSTGSASLPPPKLGAYAGASFAFLTGKLRPRASFGIPVFFDDGARFFVRGAGGLELVASNHLSVEIELGGEIDLNAAMDIDRFALVPSLGVSGRL